MYKVKYCLPVNKAMGQINNTLSNLSPKAKMARMCKKHQADTIRFSWCALYNCRLEIAYYYCNV